MGDGHGGSCVQSLAIDLGLVAFDDFRVVAYQPLATDRETTEAFGFRDSTFLEKEKTTAARADEDEFRGVVLHFTGF